MGEVRARFLFFASAGRSQLCSCGRRALALLFALALACGMLAGNICKGGRGVGFGLQNYT